MAEETALPLEQSPSRYIDKVALQTGEVLDEPIEPQHLLVSSHRDYHLVDIQARRFMSRIVGTTGDEDLARQRMKQVRERGYKASELLAKVLRRDPEAISKRLFGLKEKEYYFRYKKHPHTAEEIEVALARLRTDASAQFEAAKVEGRPAVRVLLTGGTGFVGKEILWQAAQDDKIAEVVILIRPKTIRDRKTKEVVKVLSPAERGASLLKQLWLERPDQQAKFRFIGGDVEQPRLGITDEDVQELERTITHVIHCAASVAFDDPYKASFSANVTGTLNALRFSLALQEAEDSPFVSHIGIETSYIHGRQVKNTAREDEIVFPRNFYNNYYELTKAMASIETERFMLAKGLRVMQLCPAIVIGESRAGNNRGDTKVVNAPVNVFGRAHEALKHPKGKFIERSSSAALARMACVFPGDPSAQINLIPVDRVVAGIIAALKKPEAIGERVHLATDTTVTSRQIQRTVEEEIGVKVKLAEPTLHRNVTLPVLTKVLTRFKQDRMANALNKLGSIFGGYSEWGQPVHEVGKDVSVLGLSSERPDATACFRMLCRHNRYVQEFTKVRDLDEIARREKVWWDFIVDLERAYGKPAGRISSAAFQAAVDEALDLETFERKGDAFIVGRREQEALGADARVLAAAPRFAIANVEKAASYFRDVLGFTIIGTLGEPTHFARVRRDGAVIHLGDPTGPCRTRRPRAKSGYHAYLAVDDVDALARELKGAGATIVEGPVERAYRQRELIIESLYGYRIAFGQDLSER